MTETTKPNLYSLFSYIHFNIDSPKEIKNYLMELYTCIIQREDTLSLPNFHKFFKLPLIISSKLFYVFDKSNSDFLQSKDFIKGMLTLFFPEKEIERLRLIFDFYDFDKNGLINKRDIRLILTHFHIMNNKSELRELEYILERFFGYKEDEEINYMQWQELNKNNSDVYVLTLVYFYVYRPFYQDNVNFYIYNFISPIQMDSCIKDKEPSFNDPSLNRLFAESSEEIYIYLNSQTQFTIQYIPLETNKKDSSIQNNSDELNNSTDSLNDLHCFENEKHSVIGEIENTILSNSVFPNGGGSDAFGTNQMSPTITSRQIVKNFFFSSIVSNKQHDYLISCHCLNSDRKHSEQTNNILLCNNNSKFLNFSERNSTMFGRDKKTYSKNIYSDMGIHCEIEIIMESFLEKGKRKQSSTFITTLNSSKIYEKLRLVFLNNEMYLIKVKSSSLYSYYNLNNSFFCLLSEKFINNAKYAAFTILDYSVSESKDTNVFCNSLVSLGDNCDDFTIENKIFYAHHKNGEVLNDFLQNIPNEFKERVFYDYWDIIKEIGKGAFGKVFFGRKKGDNKTKAAIKLVKKVELHPHDVEFLNWELDVFTFLTHQEHPHLIKAIDKFEDPNYIYLLYEYISNGDIGSYIQNHKHEIKLSTIYSMSLKLLNTIEYLQKFGIIHRDIKPDNILIRNIDNDGNIDIVLIDFGFSKVLPFNEKTTDVCGSPVYLAPEILYSIPYNHSADIWSFGMTLYHLVYGELPFLNMNKDYLLEQYELITKKGFDVWKDVDEDMTPKKDEDGKEDPQLDFFKKVISKCLVPEYEKRESVKELIKLYEENFDLFEEGCITCS